MAYPVPIQNKGQLFTGTAGVSPQRARSARQARGKSIMLKNQSVLTTLRGETPRSQ